MDIAETLLRVAEVTNGRVDRQDTFRDFLEFCACGISNCIDPVHLDTRTERLKHIAEKYKDQEQKSFIDAFQQLRAEIVRNVERGIYTDLLGHVYKNLHTKSGPLKQDFTPPCVGDLMGRICLSDDALPEQGYFTFMEPTCGSGVLCIKYAQRLSTRGFNPCSQVVIQASDLDRQCVYMTYIQLSLYGIPAVVIQGDAISLEEYDRWYTPVYIWHNWIWREPMPFRPGRNESDELLKMASEPWYARARMLGSFIK